MLVGHAHIAAGNGEDLDEVIALLEREGETERGSADLFVRTFNHFGVEDARELRERAAMRPVSATRRVFVLVASTITNEAQNALLKVFEEPPAHALFVLVVPSPEMLLATLRSRTQRLMLSSKRHTSIIDVKSFLSAAPKKRLELLKPLLEKGDDDKRDIGVIIGFLSDLERSLEADAMKPGVKDGIAAVYRARRYVNDKGALVKPLLEQAALLIP